MSSFTQQSCTVSTNVTSALEVFLKRYALYKFTFYLLTYLLTLPKYFTLKHHLRSLPLRYKVAPGSLPPIVSDHITVIIINGHLYTATYRKSRTAAVYKLKWHIKYSVGSKKCQQSVRADLNRNVFIMLLELFGV